MKEDSNSRLSRTADKASPHTITTAGSWEDVDVEDVQTSTQSTEDIIDSKYTSANIINNDDRQPVFVIVDSSCISNPSSKEILINKKNAITETSLKKHPKHNVIPIDIPCTSRNQTNFVLSQDQACESREELQMVDINLQSENEIIISEIDDVTEPESIVIAYIRNKDKILDNDGLPTARKKSSILENVPKMETIHEDKQIFGRVVGRTHNVFTVSPTSLHYGSDHSVDSFEEQDPHFREAIKFLHQDREFLIAAEVGNEKHLEMYIRSGADVQQIDHLGRNALHLAVCSGNLGAVRVLLEAGVNPNIKDNVGMTPLSLSLMRRPSLIVANMLFDYGATLLARSSPMDTGLFIQFAMMCTPTAEDENILRLLIEKGAVINDPNAPGGRQALHFAAMSNNTKLIHILVSLRADLYMTNHRNESPREVAATFKCNEAYKLLSVLEENQLETYPTAN